jgi:hypothetical protein
MLNDRTDQTSLSWNVAASKQLKGNQNKTLQMSQPEPDYNLPMSFEYAGALVKHKSFPYIDSNGQVYLYVTYEGGSIGPSIQKKDDSQYFYLLPKVHKTPWKACLLFVSGVSPLSMSLSVNGSIFNSNEWCTFVPST